MKRIHLIISGDVQGVGFRAYAKAQATKMGLTGWVRNREDRTVEVVAQGEKDLLEKLLAIVRRGPQISWVENVRVTWEEAANDLPTFEIRY